jgi:hypothetical protein
VQPPTSTPPPAVSPIFANITIYPNQRLLSVCPPAAISTSNIHSSSLLYYTASVNISTFPATSVPLSVISRRLITSTNTYTIPRTSSKEPPRIDRLRQFPLAPPPTSANISTTPTASPESPYPPPRFTGLSASSLESAHRTSTHISTSAPNQHLCPANFYTSSQRLRHPARILPFNATIKFFQFCALIRGTH